MGAHLNGVHVGAETPDPVVRSITESVVKRIRKGLKIATGGHGGKVKAEGSCLPASKEVCIMELASVVSGECERRGRVIDFPVCCSDALTSAFMAANDSTQSDRSRAGLVKYLPQVLGTAPTKLVWEEESRHTFRGDFPAGWYEVKDNHDERYKKAERKREAYLNKMSGYVIKRSSDLYADDQSWEPTREEALADERVPFRVKREILEGLLAVRTPKFTKAPAIPAAA